MAARLIRRLLVAADASVADDELFECFWRELDPRAARNNLHVTVHHARRILGPARLLRGDGTYRLVLQPRDRVDAREFVRLANAAMTATGGRRCRALQQALDVWTGEPLPEDRYADWSLAYREDLEGHRRAAILELSRGLRRGGQATAAIPVLRGLRQRAPLDEAAARELMLALAASGRRDEALRTFEELRGAMRRAWATDVSAATRRIAMAIGNGSEVLAGEPWAAPAATG